MCNSPDAEQTSVTQIQLQNDYKSAVFDATTSDENHYSLNIKIKFLFKLEHKVKVQKKLYLLLNNFFLKNHLFFLFFFF